MLNYTCALPSVSTRQPYFRPSFLHVLNVTGMGTWVMEGRNTLDNEWHAMVKNHDYYLLTENFNFRESEGQLQEIQAN